MHEDDLSRVILVKNLSLLLKQFYENGRPKAPRCRELSHFLELDNDALMRREGSNGYLNKVLCSDYLYEMGTIL